MMRCLAIDDEKLVRDLLEDNIRKVPYLQLVASCKNAMEAIDVLQRESIDLIFLDIQMPGLSGLQFLRSLPNPPLVVLVTAYEQYALEGFELDVVDYLLKPYGFDRFLKACNRAFERHQSRQDALRTSASPADDFFFVNVEYTQVKINVADIRYVEGLKDYVKIHLVSSDKPVLTRMTLKSMEERLAGAPFIRTHKSYLVSIPHVTAVKRDTIYIGERELPIGDAYREQVERIIRPSIN
ncbi:DNA-binding response regulator [Parapedobacter defluvii]|mgnify:CR=1 FL=1|uniref:DNA-binding response regulator n=1 Tax=Parapedobacter defluvii TaxID=2045106 RepID=A0ABQ1KXY0_9SPHI|nr:LytTR family DNA-binding domain-containing protein [Parapedobacter defluvii]GGC14186.1 DNA-binding response regulator [Parapedobacter defluvii]